MSHKYTVTFGNGYTLLETEELKMAENSDNQEFVVLEREEVIEIGK
ncbi:MAG: hypothetical protein F6K48_35505 [Okeania sp. SIO3H1]|nr:hypothetical protein [Okeania sp. SIO3H1]